MDFIIQYWLTWAFGLSSAGLALLWKAFMNQRKRQKALEDGVRALLRDRIIQSCDYYNAKQKISIHGRENIESMYKAYHSLGGNGTVTRLVEEIKDLQTFY